MVFRNCSACMPIQLSDDLVLDLIFQEGNTEIGKSMWLAGSSKAGIAYLTHFFGILRALPMQDSIMESKTINYIYLWYFADVAPYLLKKEVEKKRLQVLFRLQVYIVRSNK